MAFCGDFVRVLLNFSVRISGGFWGISTGFCEIFFVEILWDFCGILWGFWVGIL